MKEKKRRRKRENVKRGKKGIFRLLILEGAI
jgi:hypothetical protein